MVKWDTFGHTPTLDFWSKKQKVPIFGYQEPGSAVLSSAANLQPGPTRCQTQAGKFSAQGVPANSRN